MKRPFMQTPFYLELDIDNPRQLLYPVKEDVSLLDGSLILVVFAVGPIGLHDPVDLVNLAVQAASGDKTGQFPATENKSVVSGNLKYHRGITTECPRISRALSRFRHHKRGICLRYLDD